MIKVGDTLHIYDANTNTASQKWTALAVTKITHINYICGDGPRPVKIRKSDMTWDRGNYRCEAFTEQGKADFLWAMSQRRLILEQIQKADAGTLRAVDALLRSAETAEGASVLEKLARIADASEARSLDDGTVILHWTIPAGNVDITVADCRVARSFLPPRE